MAQIHDLLISEGRETALTLQLHGLFEVSLLRPGLM